MEIHGMALVTMGGCLFERAFLNALGGRFDAFSLSRWFDVISHVVDMLIAYAFGADVGRDRQARRERLTRYVVIQMDVEGRDVDGLVQGTGEKISSEVKLPPAME